MAARSSSIATPANSKNLPKRSCIAEIGTRHSIRPYQQGQLDYFCGLYSAVNAARLLLSGLAPVGEVASKAMLAAAAEYIDTKGGLHEALTWGLNLRRRHAVARHVAKVASTKECRLTLERPEFRGWSSIDDAFAWIEESLSHGKPVLAYLANLPDHYTVIAGITPTTLELFDSARSRNIDRAVCGLTSGQRIIPPNGLLRMAAERSG